MWSIYLFLSVYGIVGLWAYIVLFRKTKFAILVPLLFLGTAATVALLIGSVFGRLLVISFHQMFSPLNL
jgi:hypothetical protein